MRRMSFSSSANKRVQFVEDVGCLVQASDLVAFVAANDVQIDGQTTSLILGSLHHEVQCFEHSRPDTLVFEALELPVCAVFDQVLKDAHDPLVVGVQ